MSNKLNYYIIITLLIFIVIVGYGYISVGFPKVHELHVSSFGPLEVILSVVTVIIGISLIFIRQRLTMVILNGIIGFAVTLYFIAMKAPARFSAHATCGRNNYNNFIYCELFKITKYQELKQI